MKEGVQIAIPTGELRKPVTDRLQLSGLNFMPILKRNQVHVKNMNVEMIFIRPSSVPDLVMSTRTKTRAGITGGDILWNAGLKNQGIRLEGIPNEGTLFIGVTESLRQRVLSKDRREPTSDDLEGSIVVTKFPKIAEEVLPASAEIWPMAGSTEALQYAVEGCDGILDITASGAAVRANTFYVVENLMDPVDVQLIQQPGLSSWEERIIADFTGALQNERYPACV